MTDNLYDAIAKLLRTLDVLVQASNITDETDANAPLSSILAELIMDARTWQMRCLAATWKAFVKSIDEWASDESRMYTLQHHGYANGTYFIDKAIRTYFGEMHHFVANANRFGVYVDEHEFVLLATDVERIARDAIIEMMML